MSRTRYKWDGDLEDDCTLRVGEFIGRAECMGELKWRGIGEGEERFYSKSEHWWCAVYKGPEQLFHSGEPGGLILSGDMARAICEAIISAANPLATEARKPVIITKGTVIKYNGIPCELLEDARVYTATSDGSAFVKEVKLPDGNLSTDPDYEFYEDDEKE